MDRLNSLRIMFSGRVGYANETSRNARRGANSTSSPSPASFKLSMLVDRELLAESTGVSGLLFDCVCASTNLLYAPFASRSVTWLPVSTIHPPSTTAIISASRMVESLWAITIVVRFISNICLSSACCTNSSLSLSRALVASSNIRILGFRTSTRAMAILCFCPPLI
mmetsp:Transcript_31861/g.46324  ORF Transcript_31861/g.46324 Transcript_31861/m.46324 type:complete len:167 (-) Transcript_31861:1832-2332(-)